MTKDQRRFFSLYFVVPWKMPFNSHFRGVTISIEIRDQSKDVCLSVQTTYKRRQIKIGNMFVDAELFFLSGKSEKCVWPTKCQNCNLSATDMSVMTVKCNDQVHFSHN